jgi:hypothetical protein
MMTLGGGGDLVELGLTPFTLGASDIPIPVTTGMLLIGAYLWLTDKD